MSAPAPVTALRYRRPYSPRRKPAGRPKASVAERILARLEAAPEAVLGQTAIARQIGVPTHDLATPLTSLVLGGSVIELSAGFCLATTENKARLKAEMAARPVIRSPQPLGDLARRIVSRAHLLRREGWIGRASDLLERAGRQCRSPRIAVNFHVLADLFASGEDGYRNVTRADAARIAREAGVEAERFA